jgi:hypothetical protein
MKGIKTQSSRLDLRWEEIRDHIRSLGGTGHDGTGTVEDSCHCSE